MKFAILFCQVFLVQFIYAQKVLKPFPQHSEYYSGVIFPNHISSRIMDDSVVSFYFQWKERYVKKNVCSDNSYIWSENVGKNRECISEGQGYGMIIIVLMAGVDTSAQSTFDDLYHYYLEHPSRRNRFLMSWVQSKNCYNPKEGSASDGDIDIAYSLLLANAQWSSSGKVNYLREARNIINAIMEQEVNKIAFSVLLSNSVEMGSKDYFDMRTSDFIPSQFRSFRNATNNLDWKRVNESCYKIFNSTQRHFGSKTGLMPDFVQFISGNLRPAKKHYLESRYDGFYNYNACRVPWRIAMDYLTFGEMRAENFVEPINKWIRERTGENPSNISVGYTLEGKELKNKKFVALSFVSSFAVSSMVDAKNQQWLNKLWDCMIKCKMKDFDYYNNAIKMICIIILSHNYWVPA
jgi:endoglucanase